LSILASLNKLGLVFGLSAYPVTFAPRILKKIQSQLPLKPVCPVTKTFLPFQNFELILFITIILFLESISSLFIPLDIYNELSGNNL